jgi:putative endonuclease
MGDARHDLGLAAEQAVAEWLASSGWRVLAHRRRSRAGGEVDLVAIDPDDVLVAVEVRARRSARAGTGTETIDLRRTARIGRTLSEFAHERGARRGLRVDVVIATPMPGTAARWLLRRVPGVGAW